MAGEENKQEEVLDNPFNVNLDLLQDMGGAMFESTEETEEIEDKIETPESDNQEENQEQPENASEQQDEENEEIEDNEDPSSNDTEKPSPFTPFAKLAVEEGVLRNFNLEEWDGTPEGLVDGMNKEIQYGVNSYKEQLNPRAKWLIDNMDEGVPLESLLEVDKQRVSLDSITEEALVEDSKMQKDILTQYYKETTKFSDEAIEKYINRLEAMDEIADEAKSSLGELRTINQQKEEQLKEQAREQQEQMQKQQQEALESFKNTLTKKEEIVPGIKLSDVMKESIEKTITTPVAVDPQTGAPMNEIAVARSKDPVNFEINLAYIYKATKGFQDWSVFNSAGKKSALKEFEDAARGLDSGSKQQQRINRPAADEDLKEQIAQFANFGKKY